MGHFRPEAPAATSWRKDCQSDMKAHTSETQATITPARALEFLKEGNVRFINNLRVNRNLLQQANETRDGQWPFATVVSCIDSRTSSELISDRHSLQAVVKVEAGAIVKGGVRPARDRAPVHEIPESRGGPVVQTIAG